MTWAVNVLAPFLLTQLLLPCVSWAVVNTASISAGSTIDLTDLQGERRGYSAHGAYSLSKACNIAFTRKLAAMLSAAGGGVTTVALDPGTVNTKMLLAGWGRIGMDVAEADHTFALASDDAALLNNCGAYFIGRRPSRPPACCDDPGMQDALWQLWEQQTGGAFQL